VSRPSENRSRPDRGRSVVRVGLSVRAKRVGSLLG